MDANVLGRQLLDEAVGPQKQRWLSIMSALNAKTDSEVGEKLPEKSVYEAGGALVLFQALGIVSAGAFVANIQAFTTAAQAWAKGYHEFVAVAEQADVNLKQAVRTSAGIMLDRWQILTSKGWASGYSASDDAAQMVRDVAPKAALGLGAAAIAILVLAVVIILRPR